MVKHRRLRMLWLILLPVLTALACTIGAAPETPTPSIPPTSAIKPIVQIIAPQNNADAVVGQPLVVSATGQHPDGITRIELQANGQIVDSKVSQNPLGDAQLQTYLNYSPIAPGSVILQVIAYRNSQPSDPATITINVKSQDVQVTNTVQPPDNSGGGSVDTGDQTCRAVVAVNSLNFRQGPGLTYTSLQVLGLGAVIPITGATSDLSWWQGHYNNTTGWLSRYYITILGYCNNVPAVAIPPSPQPTQTPTPQPTSIQATVVTVPDLTITSITTDPPGLISIVLGSAGAQAVTFHITVQNIGTAPANNFSLEYTLPDGTLQNAGTVQTLGPGQQAYFKPSVVYNAPGTVRLTAIVDRANAVVESDKTNNIRSFDLLIIKPTPQPQ